MLSVSPLSTTVPWPASVTSPLTIRLGSQPWTSVIVPSLVTVGLSSTVSCSVSVVWSSTWMVLPVAMVTPSSVLLPEQATVSMTPCALVSSVPPRIIAPASMIIAPTPSASMLLP